MLMRTPRHLIAVGGRSSADCIGAEFLIFYPENWHLLILISKCENMNEKQRAASDVVGPELLKLLGLPEMTEKVTITLEGGKPIRVECISFSDEGPAQSW